MHERRPELICNRNCQSSVQDMSVVVRMFDFHRLDDMVTEPALRWVSAVHHVI